MLRRCNLKYFATHSAQPFVLREAKKLVRIIIRFTSHIMTEDLVFLPRRDKKRLVSSRLLF